MSAESDFDQLDRFLGAAVSALAGRERTAIIRTIVRELRKRNRQRITKQLAPDGTKWAPRKRDRSGRVRSKAKMLIGLRATRRMTVRSNDDGGAIGFRGRNAMIAAVHQFGRVDLVDTGGPSVKYAARPLLGISDGDRDWVRSNLLDHLADQFKL